MIQTTTLDRAVRLHTLVMPVSGHGATVVAGDLLEVQLRELGGSGAQWQVAEQPPELRHDREDVVGPGPGAVGEFSSRLFRFRAIREGTGVLRLVIGRPGALQPAGTIELHVTVTEE